MQVPARAAPVGYSAEFVGQSGVPTVVAGETATLTVFFANVGERTWVRGSATQVDLGMCVADKSACDVRDGTRSSWDPGSWLSSSRYATHSQTSVGLRQIATFVFSVKAVSSLPGGTYRFPADLVVAGTGERITTSPYAHGVVLRGAALAPIGPLLLDEADVGAGFVRVQDVPQTLADRAVRFGSPEEGRALLTAWGYVDGAKRDFSKATQRGVRSVTHFVSRYATAAGAAEEVRYLRAGYGAQAGASISSVGDESSSYLASFFTVLGQATQVATLSRTGATVSTILITAAAGEMSLEYAENLATAQATRAGWVRPAPPPAVTGTPVSTTLGGISFLLDATAARRAYVESTLGPATATTIAAALDGDIAALERLYARPATKPLDLFAFATRASFERGLVSVLGLDPEDAARVAAFAAGVHLQTLHKVALNWERVGRAAPLATIRHEASHYMFQDLVGAGAIQAVPAWFNEGVAESVEWSYGRLNWLALASKYHARSVAAAGALPSLLEMRTLEQFQSGTDDQIQARYLASAQAAAMIVNRVGYGGVVRVLDSMRAGTTFDAAFQATYGTALAQFASETAAAVRAMDASPALAAVSDTPGGPGGLYVALHGFRSSTSVSVTFSGAGHVSFTRPADVYGFVSFFYPPGMVQPGTYLIDATDGVRRASLVITVAGARVTDELPGEVALGEPEDAPKLRVVRR
ncbi:MAG TPA: hypothetical protein VFM93_01455 [Candidatus Limnocylindria bacterium]|nr:hypothetical protein [Candidatus Limnocylindria bacterium]